MPISRTARNHAAKLARRSWGISNLELPTSDVDSASLVCIQVNEHWLGVLLSAVSTLEDPETWVDDTDTDRAEQQAFTLYELIRNAGAPVTAQYPTHQTLWHYQARIVAGAVMTNISPTDTPNNFAGGFFNLLSYQSTYTSTDSFEHPVFLAAGDYDFYTLGYKNAYGGLLDWYLDGDLFAVGQDFYNATIQTNVIEHNTLTIPTDGNHLLTGVVNGTWSPSGLHFVPLVNYWFDLTP